MLLSNRTAASALPVEAEVIDIHAPEHAEFEQTLLDIYTPRYGEEWATMLDGGAWYAPINPRRMFTFWMPDDDT